jgi:hypothetical protein
MLHIGLTLTIHGITTSTISILCCGTHVGTVRLDAAGILLPAPPIS